MENKQFVPSLKQQEFDANFIEPQGSDNVDFVKVSDIKEDHVVVTVTDDTFKSLYFLDSETIGWLLLKDGCEMKMYHVYRRTYDHSTQLEVNEPIIFTDEELQGKELEEEEITKLLDEIRFQERIERKKEQSQKVKAMLGLTEVS